MIPFHFDYLLPKDMEETIDLFLVLQEKGKHPKFFAGGTEIITLGRINHLYTEAVIDIKGIPACKTMELDEHYFYLGAGKTLTEVEDANYFSLLTETSKQIADHTARTKITVGGNICGDIFYREAVLPFLISNSQVFIGGSNGVSLQPITKVFQQRLQLKEGEILLQLCTERKYLQAPYVTVKKRKQGSTGYPLITVAALKIEGKINLAISGLCDFPFRSDKMEKFINDKRYSLEDRVGYAIQQLPAQPITDTEGSAAYRLFVLKNTLIDILYQLERWGN
ncbi:MAG: FAD binding domain-containing protein [Bacillus sp. (in: Bacteria)]|nr:FAD binding domain-containing protein [Bacillus sp. (in: firmicutes)]